MLYVSEEHKLGNAKRVAGIEVFAPSPLLVDGKSFVNTPVWGSVAFRDS
jgi:hypothetical protein